MSDDPRNKVNVDSQTVSLGKEMSNSLKNGFLFGKLLQKMQSTYIKRTKKYFHFSNEMLEMKDNDRVGNRKTNWGYLFSEMKHYGVELDQNQQQKINDGNVKSVCQLLDQLFETDNTPAGNSMRSDGVTNSRLSLVTNNLKIVDNKSRYSGSIKNRSSLDISIKPNSAREEELAIQKTPKLINKFDHRKEITSASGSTIGQSTIGTAETNGRFKLPKDLSKPRNLGKLASRASRASNLLNSETKASITIVNQNDEELPEISRIGGRDISPINNKSPGPSPKRSIPQKNINALINLGLSATKSATRSAGRSAATSHSPKNKRQVQQPLANKNTRFRKNGRHQASQKGDPLTSLNDEIVDDLSLTQTSFQFVINSLSMAFEMKPQQAVGLLADNQRYLMHICVKGMKGNDYQKVKTWYSLVNKESQHLTTLLNNELPTSVGSQIDPKTLFKTLNIFKGGFYSKDKEVSNLCVNLFTSLILQINQISGEMVGETWEWFIRPTHSDKEPEKVIQVQESTNKRTSISQSKTPPKSVKNVSKKQTESSLQKSSIEGDINDSLIDNNTVGSLEGHTTLADAFLDMLMQTGLQGILYALQRDNTQKDQIAILLMHFGKHNPMELFTDQMQHFTNNWDEYAAQCQWLFLPQIKTDLCVETIQESGVLSYWVLQSLRVAEGQIDITLDDRIQSLNFLTEIWLQAPQFISNTLVSSGPAILSILKRASRDIKQTLFIVSIELMFRLLENFAVSRNPSAPFVYKTLTFLLVEFYWEIEIREMMLKHFVYIFKKLETIPVSILCEPLLKQVSISQYHSASFNVFDFEFFQTVAYHKKCSLQNALMMTDCLTKIALSSVFYAQTSINVLRTLIMRFSKSPEQLVHWQQQFRNIIATMQNMEIRKQQHNNALNKNSNKFFSRLAVKGKQPPKQEKQEFELEPIKLTKEEQLTLKMNEKLVVNLLDRLIDLGNDLLADELRQQLLDMFIGLQQQYKLESKPIKYLLKKFGFDITLMVEQRKSVTVVDPILNSSETQIEEPLIRTQTEQITSDMVPQALKSNPKTDRLIEQGKNNILEQDQNNADLQPSKQLVSSIVSPYVENDYAELRQPHLQHTPKNIATRNLRASSHKQKSEQRGRSSKQITSRIQSVRSLQQSIDTLRLYNYEKLENGVNVLRYKNALKKQTGLYKALFNKFAGVDQKGSLVIDKRTFDDINKTKSIITNQGLLKMIRQLDLSQNKTNKQLRDEVSNLTKLINLNLVKTKNVVMMNLNELDFSGFQEFNLQYLHLLINRRIDQEEEENYDYQAYQLHEKFFGIVKKANQQNSLNLPRRHFEADQDKDDVIRALTQKVNQDPSYSLPRGFTKVQEKQIKDVYQVPDALGLPEGYKMSIEILDELVAKQFGVHIIAPTPVVELVSKVKVDKLQQNPIQALKFKQARMSVSPKVQVKGPFKGNESKQSSILNSSIQSVSLMNLASPQSVPGKMSKFLVKGSQNIPSNSKVTSNAYTSIVTEQEKSNSRHEKFASNFKTTKTLTAAMQLAIMEAPQDDQATIMEVASILNEVITAVEVNKERSSSPIPRHMSKYVSRKTLRKQESEEKKKNLSQGPTDVEKRLRAKSLKQQMDEQERFIQQQIEKNKKAKEDKIKQNEIDKEDREKNEKFKKQKFDQIKEQLKLKQEQEKEKKEKEDLVKAEEAKAKEKEQKQERKMLILRRKQFAKDAELKAKERKDKEEKERLEKEEQARIAKAELAEKIEAITKKREEMSAKKEQERKKSSKPRGKNDLNNLKNADLLQKLQKEGKSPNRDIPHINSKLTGSIRQSTHLAKIEPLLREETVGHSTVELPKEDPYVFHTVNNTVGDRTINNTHENFKIDKDDAVEKEDTYKDDLEQMSNNDSVEQI